MNYIQVAIETKTEAVEAISYLLMEQGVGGVEIEDPKDILMSTKSPTSWDYVEPELISGDPNVVTIKVYFPEHMNHIEKIADIKVKIDAMREYLDVGTGSISTVHMEEQEWANEWKKYYKLTPIGKNIMIKPTWIEYTPKNDQEIIIELDPGMAFGTGTHETTSMCMELLEKYVTEKDIVLDIGTGSGILGITAAKLGANKVIGVDLDQTAVKVAKENIDENKVSDIMEARYGDLLEIVKEKGNIVIANIIADVIIPLSETVTNVMLEDALFISSGIIEDRIDDVKAAIERKFDIIEVLRKGEWAAIVAKKKGE
ncbi:MAG TPA: 50S ribosomal protein L11 methyltransferase [Epulopiscium sp.]|nr:50S ribosomal protein L11 methyltransferase [Candidatus Epulonipiscium sp.]